MFKFVSGFVFFSWKKSKLKPMTYLEDRSKRCQKTYTYAEFHGISDGGVFFAIGPLYPREKCDFMLISFHQFVENP